MQNQLPDRSDATPQPAPTPRARLAIAISAAAALAAVAVVLLTLAGEDGPPADLVAQPTAEVSAIAALREEPHVVFLQSDGDAYRRLSLTPLRPGGEVLATKLICQRAYFAGGQGVCLGEGANALEGGLAVFASDFSVRHRIDIGGIPSRARVSPDGRFAAVTVFVSGHSYAEAGFSTRTAIVDLAAGRFVIDDLESMTVTRDGRRFSAIDFNFWGVTFARDSNRFYATLGSGGKTYLIEGNVAAAEARVLREDVECPSLSPDGNRIVFKKRSTRGLLQQVEWQLYVLDLATMSERRLGETRSVDDQVEWLDGANVIYFLKDEGPPSTIRPDLWVAAVDGDAAPRRLWTRAFSPAVVQR